MCIQPFDVYFLSILKYNVSLLSLGFYWIPYLIQILLKYNKNCYYPKTVTMRNGLCFNLWRISIELNCIRRIYWIKLYVVCIRLPCMYASKKCKYLAFGLLLLAYERCLLSFQQDSFWTNVDLNGLQIFWAIYGQL